MQARFVQSLADPFDNGLALDRSRLGASPTDTIRCPISQRPKPTNFGGDSATGEEIVRLFGELHSAGHTIVLVTHEPKLAARCPRAVRLSDGKVVGDGIGKDIAFGDGDH